MLWGRADLGSRSRSPRVFKAQEPARPPSHAGLGRASSLPACLGPQPSALPRGTWRSSPFHGEKVGRPPCQGWKWPQSLCSEAGLVPSGICVLSPMNLETCVVLLVWEQWSHVIFHLLPGGWNANPGDPDGV